jgi:hypothetical protein
VDLNIAAGKALARQVRAPEMTTDLRRSADGRQLSTCDQHLHRRRAQGMHRSSRRPRGSRQSDPSAKSRSISILARVDACAAALARHKRTLFCGLTIADSDPTHQRVAMTRFSGRDPANARRC